MALSQAGLKTYSNTAVTQVVVGGLTGSYLIFNIFLFNSNAAATYLQLFDLTSGNVNLGTTVADLVLPMPAGGVVNIAMTAPLGFRNGVSFAVTSTATGDSAPSGSCMVQFAYTSG